METLISTFWLALGSQFLFFQRRQIYSSWEYVCIIASYLTGESHIPRSGPPNYYIDKAFAEKLSNRNALLKRCNKDHLEQKEMFILLITRGRTKISSKKPERKHRYITLYFHVLVLLQADLLTKGL